MSLEAARDLSITDILRILNEKVDFECARVRTIPMPPPVLAASLEAEIEMIETKAYELLRFTTSLRNRLQPVNKLPPEIVSRIAQNTPSDVDKDTNSIIPLTHVCRYWRESIISTPEIWTKISSSSHFDLAALSLERAKAAPLDVYLDMRIGTPAFLNLLTPYIQNTGSCRAYSISDIKDLTQGLPNFPWSMPTLRSLELCRPSRGELDRSVDPFKPSSSTVGRLPKLAYLKLIGIPLYPSLLRLRTLTRLSLHDREFNLHLDILLNFLEENRSLDTATLGIKFVEHSLRHWQRRATIGSQFQSLSIHYTDAMDARALVSSIALTKGAHLELISYDLDTGLNGILSGISITHLSNLSSPTFMEYHSYPRRIRLVGLNGSASFTAASDSEIPFAEFPLLPLANVRELNVTHSLPPWVEGTISLPAFQPSFFPALETLAMARGTSISHIFPPLWSSPSSCPSLKTIAFLDCPLTEVFMTELSRFASNRKNTASVWLQRVVIVHQEGIFPSSESIQELGKHVPVVDVLMGTKLPTDL